MGVEMEATKIMALKFKLKSKGEVPAELVNLYLERDGAWLLDVDGTVDKAKLEELRATNVALMKERDELKQRFEGIDPDEVRKLGMRNASSKRPSNSKPAKSRRLSRRACVRSRAIWTRSWPLPPASAMRSMRDSPRFGLTKRWSLRRPSAVCGRARFPTLGRERETLSAW